MINEFQLSPESESEATIAFARFVAELYEASGALRQCGEQLAALANQTNARWQILSIASEGRYTIPQMGRRLGLSRQGVQRVANHLVDEQMATFENNPDHQRSPILQLTDKGKEALETIRQQTRTWRDTIASKLDSEHLEITRKTLQQLNALIEQHPPPSASKK